MQNASFSSSQGWLAREADSVQGMVMICGTDWRGMNQISSMSFLFFYLSIQLISRCKITDRKDKVWNALLSICFPRMWSLAGERIRFLFFCYFYGLPFFFPVSDLVIFWFDFKFRLQVRSSYLPLPPRPVYNAYAGQTPPLRGKKRREEAGGHSVPSWDRSHPRPVTAHPGCPEPRTPHPPRRLENSATSRCSSVGRTPAGSWSCRPSPVLSFWYPAVLLIPHWYCTGRALPVLSHWYPWPPGMDSAPEKF